MARYCCSISEGEDSSTFGSGREGKDLAFWWISCTFSFLGYPWRTFWAAAFTLTIFAFCEANDPFFGLFTLFFLPAWLVRATMLPCPGVLRLIVGLVSSISLLTISPHQAD